MSDVLESQTPLDTPDLLGRTPERILLPVQLTFMASQSLRSLKLPLTAAGKPEVVCQEILAPLFEAAVETILVCTDPKPEHLARMTWGLAPFVREGSKLTLLVMVTDPMPAEMNPDSLRVNWKESLKSQKTAHRLSLYKYFSQENRFTLCVRPIADCGIGDSLRVRLVEGMGIVLVTDLAATMADVLWREIPHSEGALQVGADFRWSYGDPMRSVQNLHKTIAAISRKPVVEPFAQIEGALNELIELLPAPKLPWEETFGESGEPERGLYPHQRAAVDAWFANGRHGIFKMCTGAGKTIAALAAVLESSEKAARAGEKPLPVIVTVPTRVLADQWCCEIERYGFSQPLKAYNAKQSWHPLLRAMLRSSNGTRPNFVVSTYCTFGDEAFASILKQLEREGHRGLWIADEMHNLASTRLLDQMDKLGGYFSERIGLSATPEIENEEAKTRRLFQFFEDGRQITCGQYELADGIRDGVLCRYHYHPFPQYLEPENSRRFLEVLNALAQQEVAGRVDIDLYRQKREIIRTSGVQVDAFRRLVERLLTGGPKALKHTLVYCPPGFGASSSDLDAAVSDEGTDERDEDRLLTEVVRILAEHGVMAESILGITPPRERDRILREFRTGEIQVICAVACLDEGVDIPDIRRAIVLYSVNREKQFVQRRGRILRRNKADPAKVAEIHDVVILPQGSTLPPARADELLKRELRRYESFAVLAENRPEADRLLALALRGAADEPAAADMQI